MRKHLIIVLGVFLLCLVAGVQMYHVVEGWNYLDSTYFIVITATTIGYGDLVPQTAIGKIITIIFSFVGIATAFTMISIVGKFIFRKEAHRVKEYVEQSKKRKK